MREDTHRTPFAMLSDEQSTVLDSRMLCEIVWLLCGGKLGLGQGLETDCVVGNVM